MQLSAELKESARTGSGAPIRKMISDFPEMFGLDEHIAPEAAVTQNDQMLMNSARLLVGEVVTHKLEGTSMGLVSCLLTNLGPNDPDTFLLSQNPPNLLAAAYVNFAQAVVHRAHIRECPGCGRRFIPSSGKQKYHTKSCASTSRWREWKESQTE
jgi:hypothetical protein